MEVPIKKLIPIDFFPEGIECTLVDSFHSGAATSHTSVYVTKYKFFVLETTSYLWEEPLIEIVDKRVGIIIQKYLNENTTSNPSI